MAVRKKDPEEKHTETPGSTRSLRDDAEGQLTRTPKNSSDLKEKTPGQLIHELQVHQVELETQADELRRAQLALEESRDQYVDLYDFAPIGYLTLTDKALITEVNLAAAILFGVDRKKLVNDRFRRFVAQKNLEQWDQNFVNVLHQEEKQAFTLTLKRGDGSVFPARLEGVLASSCDGATTIRLAFSDISDIWQIEALAESEKRLKSYIENAPDGVFIADETGRYLEVNPAACRITGYKKEELLAMHIPDLLPPESFDAGAKHFKEVIKSGQGSGELRFRHKDGSLRYWSVDAVRLSPTRFIGFVKDITVRLQAEKALHESRKQLIQSEEALRIHQVELETQAEELQKSHLALGESRDQYLDLYDFAPLGYLTLTGKALIAEVNLTGATLLGVERSDLLKAPFSKFIAEKDSGEWYQYFKRILTLEGKQVCTLTFNRGDGSMFPARLEGVRLTSRGGSITVRIAIIDITDIRQSEEALRNSEEKYRILIDNSHDIIYTTNLEGIFTFVSPSWTTLLGHPVTQVIGKPFQQFVHPDDFPACLLFIQRMIETGQQQTGIDYRVLHADGTWRWHRTNSVPLRNKDGRIVGGEGIASDISERRQAEERLKQSEFLLRSMIESPQSIIIFSLDLNFRYLAFNTRHQETMKAVWGKDISPGMNMLDVIGSDSDRKKVKQNYDRALLGEHFTLTEEYGDDVLGRKVWENTYSPIYDEKHQVTGFTVYVIDITDRKRAEVAVHEAQMRTETILEAIADTFYSLDDQWRFSMVNPAAEKAPLGMPASELIGRVIWEVYPGLAGTRIYQHYLDAAKNHSLEHYDAQSPLDGRWYEVFMQGRKGGVDVYMRDITDRKQAEEAVRESENRYRTLFEQNSDSIFVADPKTLMITDCNRKAEQVTGYSRAELLFLQVDTLHPEDVRTATMENFMKMKEGMDSSVDSILSTRDGKRVPVLITGGPVVVNGQTLLLGSFRDMTRQKQAEDALRRVNQKLNVLSQLTRTELTSQIFLLDGYVEMAKSYAAGQDRIIEALQKGEKAIRLLRGTIAYSKDYQDMGVTPPVWQNVKRTMLFGLSHLPISTINHSLETENLEVFADPLLEKACQRLFENSLAHGGHVSRVRVWHTVTSDGVSLAFEDDGVGIPVEMKEQIFLHDEDTRTSVRGLFFIREILDITGITITETGEPGKGARFEMAVPNGMWRITGGST